MSFVKFERKGTRPLWFDPVTKVCVTRHITDENKSYVWVELHCDDESASEFEINGTPEEVVAKLEKASIPTINCYTKPDPGGSHA